MRTSSVRAGDGRETRRYLRDLAALTALPAVWRRADRRQIAEGLADVLMKVVDTDLVFVRLKAEEEKEAVEVLRTAEGVEVPGAWAIGDLIEPFLSAAAGELAGFAFSHPLAPGRTGATLVPIGSGAEYGVVAVSAGPPFPTEEDRLLLGVAANQAALALERRRADQAQRLLASIVEHSEDAIVSKTLDGVITSWNAGAERLFGYSAAEAIGQKVTLIIPAERRHEEDTILGRVRRGERIEHYETVRQTKEGRLIDVSLTVSPIADGLGRLVGASKVARNITAQKSAERALRDADRRKDEFLAILSHELRNPLAPIRNAVEILRSEGAAGEELRLAREVIDRQSHQLTRLVDDLLDLSRISRGRIELRKERVELAQLVSRAVETSRPLIEKWGHQLTVELPPERVFLEVDPVRLSTVLQNLLNNAAKYTERDGQIWLTVARTEAGLVIRVRDTGIGIPAEMLPRVFEMFTQVGTSTERSREGLGIGLALVERLVEMHGGSVEAHSEGPGKGCEFVVRLPLPPGAEALQAPGPATRGAALPAVPKRRILVVDDNRDAADSLVLLLRLQGHEVSTAYDGQEAVEAASALRPEVILLDIGLPKLDGYEAGQRVRQELGGSVTLIALTGWGQQEDRRRSREVGFDHHLTKPVEIDALLGLLATQRSGR